jgi:prepilin-type N-terminal cleavage/methylation domain-containing protein
MIHFKNHNRSGFTLIEVMFAVLVLGLVLIPLVGNQMTIVTRVIRASLQLQRTSALAYFLTDSTVKASRSEVKEKTQKKIDDPAMELTFELKKIEGDKKFKRYPDIYLQKAVGKWQENGKPQTDTMISFLFKPAEKREKK